MGSIQYNPPVLDAVMQGAATSVARTWQLRARGLQVSLHLNTTSRGVYPAVFVSAGTAPLRVAVFSVTTPLGSRTGEVSTAEFVTGVVHGALSSRRDALSAAQSAHRQLLALCPPWDEFASSVDLAIAELHLGDLDDVEIICAGSGRYVARRATGEVERAMHGVTTPLGTVGDLKLARRTLLYGESAAMWLDLPDGPDAVLTITPAPVGL